MVDGLKSETLMEISGDKGDLSGGVRVSEESEVLTGESNKGAVVSAIESKSTQSSKLGSNERNDVSRNRSAEKVSRNDRWESWGVMNMVGKVLGGKLAVDDEMEDVNFSEDRGQVSVVGGVKASQDVVGEQKPENRGEVNLAADVIVELASANGIDIKSMDIDSGSAKLDLDCLVEGSSLMGNQDLVSRDIVPDGNLESEEINDVKADVLIPIGFGEQDLHINEVVPEVTLESGEVTDVKADLLIPKGGREQDLHINEIVPEVTLESGEVNDAKADLLIPKECGEEMEEERDMLAPKECGDKTEKEGKYNVSDLVWGKVRSHPWWPGQIFAPSAASDNAKKYYKKESYLVAYFGDQSFAWNDGSKLMPFRKCFSEMYKQSNTDGFAHALSCVLDEAARRTEFALSCPCWAKEDRDEIEFQVVENAGIREESSIIAGGDSVFSAATFLPGDVLQFLESLAKSPKSERDRLQFTIAKAELQAYTRWKGYDQLPVFEECIGFSEDDTRSNEVEEGNDLIEVPVSDAANDIPSKKRKSTSQNGSSDEERPKRKEKFMSVLMSSGSSCTQKNDKVYVRKASRKPVSSSSPREMVGSTSSNSKSKKRKTLTGAATSGIDAGESQIVEIIPDEIPTPDMVLSTLVLAAKMPKKGQVAMIPVAGWLRQFRNSICLEKPSLVDQNVDLGKHREEQSSQTADLPGFGGIEDSYWTDRIVRNYPQDQAISESQKPYKNSNDQRNLDDNKESNDVVNLGTGNQSAPTNEVTDEYRPTALILNFKSLDSIPSIKDLNEMFRRYGALDESETTILSKSRRVKVIFNRPADAETAFSSAAKYNVFGPSLISYRLRYIQKPSKSPKTSKKKKKKRDEQDRGGTSQNVNAV